MEREIKIVLKDADDPEWHYHPFDVFVDGEQIPRIKRFALDFKYFDIDQKNFDLECFKYTVEQFLDICQKNTAKEDFTTLSKKDTQNLWKYIHSNPLVKRMLNAETESDSMRIFEDAVKSGEANPINKYNIATGCLHLTVRHNISTLTKQGFDITYNSDTNKMVIKNIEHLAELDGDSIEETNKMRKEAEDLISETTNMVKALDDIKNTND